MTSFGTGSASTSSPFVARKILWLRKRQLRSNRKSRTFAGSSPVKNHKSFSRKLYTSIPSQISLWWSHTSLQISIICHIRPSSHPTINLLKKFCINYHRLEFLSLLRDISQLNNSTSQLPRLDCKADHPSEYRNNQNSCLPMRHSTHRKPSQKYREEVDMTPNLPHKSLEDRSKNMNYHQKWGKHSLKKDILRLSSCLHK